jgi:hypothetical protein
VQFLAQLPHTLVAAAVRHFYTTRLLVLVALEVAETQVALEVRQEPQILAEAVAEAVVVDTTEVQVVQAS